MRLSFIAVPFVLTSPWCLAQGPAIVNAPVAPETIYVFRAGQGLSLVDLNGFGCSTGDPTYDLLAPSFQEGWSNYIHNPNLVNQGALLGLPLPTTTLNGGSSGVFTLTRNSDLENVLLPKPEIGEISDLMLGRALDTLFNNSPSPFGCTEGSPNLCALSGLKFFDPVFSGPNTITFQQPGQFSSPAIGLENPISIAPRPNPPPLLDMPSCLTPLILGAEPIAADTGLPNLLVPGDPFGVPAIGLPPNGLLSPEQNGAFAGPGSPQAALAACGTYGIRQQIGHFLYLADATNDEIVAVNSNNMRVLDRIDVPKPTKLAMSPDLRWLAVTHRAHDSVSFIDIDPTSPTFHKVRQTLFVEDQPTGIAWDPGNEDLFICNEGSGSVSIVSAFGFPEFSIRKTLRRGLEQPFAVAITQRQDGFGHDRRVYYAYILDRTGHVSLYESGPKRYGFDQIIGRAPFQFVGPTAMQPDPLRLESGVWITYTAPAASTGPVEPGYVANLVLDSQTTGPIVIQPNELPSLRGLSFRIEQVVGPDQLTGVPTDLAFDNLRNLGSLPESQSKFSAGIAAINGKGQVRRLAQPFAQVLNTNEAKYLFLPVSDPATGEGFAIDVVDLDTGLRVDVNAFQDGVQSIPAEGAQNVADYFRQ